MFKYQIGRNIEVHIDDLLIKSIKVDRHIINLEEAFSELQQHQMKLNSNKRVFEVTSKKFLGFLITQQGKEVNSEKIQALLDLKHRTTKQNIQNLADQVIALS